MRISKLRFTAQDKNLFFPTLKQRIDLYFQEKQMTMHANSTMVIKSIVLLLICFIPYLLLVQNTPPLLTSLLLWSIMGFGVAGAGMSIMHDGNHGAYSSNKAINFIMGHVINLLGASSFNWKLQHNIMHHTYTNIDGMDEDIEDKGILRFSPHSKAKKIHRMQWLYAFPFYGLLTLYWVVAKDFIQFFKYIRNGINTNTRGNNIIAFFKIIMVKLVYFSFFLAIPSIIFDIPFWEVVAGFVTMHFVAGVILATTFQLAHTVEGTSHPLPNEKGNIENEWAVHQLNTTVNFSRNSHFLSWYLGGLNYQIEHHLFPNISHVHYPNIANIVKDTAQEFNIPYLENKTLLDALKSHIMTLRRLGN